MSEEKVITEEEAHTNPLLGLVVQPESELKEYLVKYVGTKFDNEQVTVNMIAETLALNSQSLPWLLPKKTF